ncbi:MAG TPA: hypothetical protein PKC24_13850, partial [Cyclobacteriaceae bacterium]|nr:hypothetical protein [Cyclobacteriaceae bacterium]
GNGSRVLVILRENEPPEDPNMYQTYSASTTFGNGASAGGGSVVFNGTGTTVNVTRLEPNTTYHARIIEFNGTSDPVYNFDTALTGSRLTATAPIEGSTNFNISNTQGDRLGISFSRGDGARRLVVARQDFPVDWTPTDGIDYTPNTTFSQGDEVAEDTYIVARLTSTSATNSTTTTGLTPSTNYHYAIFEFNGETNNTFYLTDESFVLRGEGTTLSPPTEQGGNFVFTNIDGNSASVSFDAGNGDRRIVLARIGEPVEDIPTNLVSHTTNITSNWNTSPSLGNSKIVNNGTSTNFNLSNLQPATTYYFAVFEYNGSSGPVYNQNNPGTGSFTTAGAPSIAPSNLTFSNIEGNSIRIHYNTGDGLGRMVIAKSGAPVDAFPEDGIAYSNSTTFGNGHELGEGNFVISNNTSTGASVNTTVNNLLPNQTYYFAVIEFNGVGDQRLYMQAEDALVGSETTITTPSQQATNISFTDITPNSVTINWENGDGDGRLVLIRPEEAIEDFPVDLTSYGSSNSNYPSAPFLGTSKRIYRGTGTSVTVTNIPPGEYHIAVIEFNGSSGPVYRNIDPLLGVVSIGSAPETPATNVSTSNIQGNRFTVNFTRGDGISRLGIVKQGGPVDAWPVDGNAYSASSTFGNGSELGDGNFVVYSGTGNSFNVLGLSPESNYHFAIVEFNGSGSSSFYQDPSIIAIGNESTLFPPTVQSSNFFANNVTGNRMQITWTNGNGNGRVVVARMGEEVNEFPQDLSSISSSNTFGNGADLGNGNYVVSSTTGDSFNLLGLEPDTTYHLAFFEY